MVLHDDLRVFVVDPAANAGPRLRMGDNLTLVAAPLFVAVTVPSLLKVVAYPKDWALARNCAVPAAALKCWCVPSAKSISRPVLLS